MFGRGKAKFLIDTEAGIIEQPEPATNNYWPWAKWGGGIAVVGLVVTAGVYYGGEPFVAALSSLGTGVMSLFGRGGQDTTALTTTQQHTDLTPVTDRPAGSELPIVWDEVTQEQLRRQKLRESLAAYSQTDEWRKYQEELGISDIEEGDDEDQAEEIIFQTKRDVAYTDNVEADGKSNKLAANKRVVDMRSTSTVTYFYNDIDLATLTPEQGFRIYGAAAGDLLGRSVGDFEDIDSDQIPDLIIGAITADPLGRTSAGITYVLFGNNTLGSHGDIDLANLIPGQGFRIYGATAGDVSGYSISNTHDVNDDQIPDLMVGAAGADPLGRDKAGITYILFGNNTLGSHGDIDLANLTPEQGFRIYGATANDNSGISVSSVEDIDGNQIPDLMIGAIFADPLGRDKAGITYILFGNNTLGSHGDIDLANLTPEQGFRIYGAVTNDWCGMSVDSIVDINGDKISNLIIGAHGADPLGRNGAGITYILFGNNTLGSHGDIDLANLIPGQGFRIYGATAGDVSASSVRGIKNINGDQILDFMIGAPFADPLGRTSAGITYVLFGNHTHGDIDLANLTPEQGFRIYGVDTEDQSGYSVSTGDLDGDQIPDLMIGAVYADPLGRSDAGIVYILYGNSLPVLVNNRLTLSEGETVVLDQTHLSITDANHNATSLRFNVVNPQNGYFAITGNSSLVLQTFTQQQINDQQISFIHHVEEAPYYEISITDSYVYTSAQPAEITFMPVNDMPELLTNQLVINNGETVVITTAMLDASDVDNTADELTYLISNLSHGQFEDIDNPGVVITSFTHQQVIDNKIRFIHDGSNTAPSYQVRVTDSDLTTTPELALVGFNLGSTAITTSNSEPSPNGTNLGVVLGAAIGGSLALCLITGAGIIWLSRRNRNTKLDEVALESASKPYRRVREIGHGGYATVYEGKYRTSTGVKIDVAAKELHRTYIESDGLESVKAEFVREAELLQRLQHPNLVEIVTFIPDPHWCILLKYYHRGSLANVLRDSKYPLPWDPDRNGFIVGIAEGLRFLHDNDIIHRDMKPDNVLIDENMRPKITDFGTATIQDTLTKTKGIGTPTYMAPEVIRPEGKVHYDSTVDVYSFALILWAIWQRQEPFQKFEDMWEMIRCVVDEHGRPHIEDCPSVSLAGLMSRCWAHRAEDRPKMPEVCQELPTVTSELAVRL